MIDKESKEAPIRSIIKALSWRIFATGITIIALFIITGKIKLALSIGIIDIIVKLIVYYFHERLNLVLWMVKQAEKI